MPTKTPTTAGMPVWLDLMTPHSEAIRPFYEALLGWTFEQRGSEKGDYGVALSGSRPVAAVVPPFRGQSLWFLYFASTDVQADAERLRELGGQVSLGPLRVGDHGHLLMATDPTGAPFGLWQSGQPQGLGRTGAPGTFAWAELQTRDADRARDFYTALLNNTSRKVPGMEYHTLYRGQDQNVGVMQMDEIHWPPDLPSRWMLYFSVTNTDEAVRTAQASGGRPLSAPHDSPYGRLAVLQDPAGATFSVIQLP
ncbi:putative glyoxylase CFP32 [Deinococcus carri]|uniref:Glyoxylase CFP32 n=1 Tax=Deinococcus carri TaxID=1211323 RepID=A0ABP9WB24_9DEIO